MRSRFTPETRGSVLQGVRAGLSLAEAAEAAEVPPKTLRNWLTRGRGENGTEHAAFAVAVDAARDAAAAAPMDVGEFRRHLNAAVRRGSVAALKLWHSIHAEEAAAADVDGGVDPFAALDAGRDELARGRLAALDAAGPDFTSNTPRRRNT